MDESRPNPASVVTDKPVEIKPAANTAPKFPDEDPEAGRADPVEMEVEENTDIGMPSRFKANATATATC